MIPQSIKQFLNRVNIPVDNVRMMAQRSASSLNQSTSLSKKKRRTSLSASIPTTSYKQWSSSVVLSLQRYKRESSNIAEQISNTFISVPDEEEGHLILHIAQESISAALVTADDIVIHLSKTFVKIISRMGLLRLLFQTISKLLLNRKTANFIQREVAHIFIRQIKSIQSPTEAEQDAAKLVVELLDRLVSERIITIRELVTIDLNSDGSGAWLLEPLFEPLRMRLGRLDRLRTPTTSETWVYCNSNVDTIMPRIHSEEWWKRVHELVNALAQRAPPQFFSDLRQSSSRNNNNDQQSRKRYTQLMLHEAVILRIIQLVNAPQHSNPERERSEDPVIANLPDKALIPWMIIADQLYFFLSKSILHDFNRLICGDKDNDIISIRSSEEHLANLPSSYHQDINDDMDNSRFVAWLILQILPSNVAKSSLVRGNKEKDREVVQFLIHNLRQLGETAAMAQQATDVADMEKKADTYVYFIVRRLLTLHVTLSDSPEFLDRVRKINEPETDWWHVQAGEGKNLNFYKLDQNQLKSVATLSTFLTKPISEALISFLTHNSQENNPLMLPNGLSFTGKTLPLPMHFILSLSVHTRCRIFDLIGISIEKPKLSSYLPPGVVETYARIAFAAPGFLVGRSNPLLKIAHLKNESIQHMLIDMLGYRMPRLFRHFGNLAVLSQLLLTMEKTKNLRIYLSAMTAFSKLVLHRTPLHILSTLDQSLLRKHKALLPVVFHATARRICCASEKNLGGGEGVMLSASRTHELTKQMIVDLVTSLSSTSSNIFLDQTTNNFPEPMRSHFTQLSKKSSPFSTNDIRDHWQEHQQFYSQIKSFEAIREQLNTLISENKMTPSYYLCTIWTMLARSGTTSLQPVFSQILLQFEPSAVLQGIEDCIRFIHSCIGRVFDLSQACSALCTLIWSGTAPMEATLWTLCTDCFHPDIIEYIFLRDERLKERKDRWLEINSAGRDPGSFKEHFDLCSTDNFFNITVSYHDKYPDMISKHTKLPIYYGNECLAIIQVLDVIFCLLIETEQWELLERILDNYGPLYQFHESPVTFVRDTLVYYADVLEERSQIRTKLAALVLNMAPFSNTFRTHINNSGNEQSQQANNLLPEWELNVPSDDFNQEYFVDSLNMVAELMPTVPSSPPSAYSVMVSDIWKEFQTPFDRCLNTVVLEYMCLPKPLSEIGTTIFDYLLDSSRNGNFSSCRVQAAGLVVAHMPPACTQAFLEQCAEYLKDHPEIVDPSSQLCVYPVMEFHQVSKTHMATSANIILALIHTYIQYASASTIENLSKHFLASIKSLRTLYQLFFLCRCFAPFAERLALHGILGKCLQHILRCMKTLPIRQLLFARSQSVEGTWLQMTMSHNTRITLIDDIADFLFECKDILKRNGCDNDLKTLRSSLKMLHPIVQEQFSNF